jgi:hypothetical protein
MEESVGRVEVRGSGLVVGRGGGNFFFPGNDGYSAST